MILTWMICLTTSNSKLGASVSLPLRKQPGNQDTDSSNQKKQQHTDSKTEKKPNDEVFEGARAIANSAVNPPPSKQSPGYECLVDALDQPRHDSRLLMTAKWHDLFIVCHFANFDLFTH
jgi:hypothetical protein